MPPRFFRRGRGTPPGHPAAPSSVPACGWAGPGLLDSHRPKPPGPSSSGTARGPPAGSGRGHRISSPGLPSCPSALCCSWWSPASDWMTSANGDPDGEDMMATAFRLPFLGFGTSVTKFVGRKEADRVGSWRLGYVYLRQINSHRCALCVTRKHQLSRSSPRSLSVFFPTVSLWQLVRSSLHSVSLWTAVPRRLLSGLHANYYNQTQVILILHLTHLLTAVSWVFLPLQTSLNHAPLATCTFLYACMFLVLSVCFIWCNLHALTICCVACSIDGFLLMEVFFWHNIAHLPCRQVPY